MIRFEFTPYSKGQLNELYQKLEKSINEMNKANDFRELNYWSVVAMCCVMEIYKINNEVIDLNSMGK